MIRDFFETLWFLCVLALVITGVFAAAIYTPFPYNIGSTIIVLAAGHTILEEVG